MPTAVATAGTRSLPPATAAACWGPVFGIRYAGVRPTAPIEPETTRGETLPRLIGFRRARRSPARYPDADRCPVRDSAQNPDTLLGTVDKAVAAEIDPSVSLLFVHDPASGEPELRAFTDRSGRPGWMPPDAMAQLAGQSSSLTAVERLSEADVPEALVQPTVPVPSSSSFPS